VLPGERKTHLVGQLCHWAHSATELDLGLPAACQSGVLLLWVQSTKKKKKREETRFWIHFKWLNFDSSSKLK
jgi:hypothetical protein